MARSRTNKSKANSRKNTTKASKPFNSFNLMTFFVFSLFLFFVAYVEGDNLWKFVHNIFLGLFGVLAVYIGPIYLSVAIFHSIKSDKPLFRKKIYEIFALLLIICAVIQTYDYEKVASTLSFYDRLQNLKTVWALGLEQTGGGVVGETISLLLSYFFGRQVAFLVFWIIMFFLFFTITGVNFAKFIQLLIKPCKAIKSIKQEPTKQIKKTNSNISNEAQEPPPQKPDENFNYNDFSKELIDNNSKAVEKEFTSAESAISQFGANPQEAKANDFNSNASETSNQLIGSPGGVSTFNTSANEEYDFPSTSLLNKPVTESNIDVSLELKANALRLVDTLKSFGVETRISNINRGPTVTRYELQPSVGVKISKITNLADDISLNLAVGGVRIEAPIPNKSAVGIEVPNKKKEIVVLREIVSSEDFVKAKSPLTVALGKDIAGKVVIADIEKMPHILIAGSTGSGKSVCINSLIVSLIYKSSPKRVRLLLIDPKVVELGVYNKIAHLLIPVVTDPKKAAGALNWAVKEMLKRYKLFASVGARDLNSYNSQIASNKTQETGPLPQIVIIVDELADLMMAASKDVENSICRLAQMARAAGMHLVIATQRPSVDVITGLIKANIPSRIAFTVSSQIDSRTIIDMAGAEKLLGKGDMLYFPVGKQKPLRVQGCFLSDKEVERVVSAVQMQDEFSNENEGNEIMSEIARHAEQSGAAGVNLNNSSYEDPKFKEAAMLVVEEGHASTSFLQRRLKLGYSRAARIMDDLETAGIVSQSASGASKGRKVLMTKQQLLEMQLNKSN